MALTFMISTYSCENDTATDVSNNHVAKTISTAKPGDNEEVLGILTLKGEFIWKADKNKILENWNNNLKRLEDIDAQLTHVEFLIIDGEKYLRANGASWGSTLALKGAAELTADGISCTSKACSGSDTECVPKANKKSCTSCGWDCTKTVTALSASLVSSYALRAD